MICIYKISNSINNRIYIGSAINYRLRKNRHITQLNNNIHCNKKLQRFVNKYGIDKLKFTIVEECKKDELLNKEQFHINNSNCLKNGFNILPIAGSWLNHKHSNLSKQKQSKVKKGKQSTGMLNKKHSEFTKELIRQKAIGRKQSEITIKKRVKKNTGKKRPESAILTVRDKLIKLTQNDILEIREMLNNGIKQTEIAKKFNVCQRNISRIKQGISYTQF